MEEEGVAGVCVADELGLCVASSGDVDPCTAGVLADIARTARIFFAPEDAAGLVTFVETEKTFVLSSWNHQQSNTTEHFLLPPSHRRMVITEDSGITTAIHRNRHTVA